MGIFDKTKGDLSHNADIFSPAKHSKDMQRQGQAGNSGAGVFQLRTQLSLCQETVVIMSVCHFVIMQQRTRNC